ncbi:hypothetical protein B0H13DRAFT_2667915 [Mycena leptocephala]|nr:hypothetical protein B0H13DRAFT_2667915 [Mycena leptocephala]
MCPRLISLLRCAQMCPTLSGHIAYLGIPGHTDFSLGIKADLFLNSDDLCIKQTVDTKRRAPGTRDRFNRVRLPCFSDDASDAPAFAWLMFTVAPPSRITVPMPTPHASSPLATFHMSECRSDQSFLPSYEQIHEKMTNQLVAREAAKPNLFTTRAVRVLSALVGVFTYTLYKRRTRSELPRCRRAAPTNRDQLNDIDQRPPPCAQTLFPRGISTWDVGYTVPHIYALRSIRLGVQYGHREQTETRSALS